LPVGPGERLDVDANAVEQLIEADHARRSVAMTARRVAVMALTVQRHGGPASYTLVCGG